MAAAKIKKGDRVIVLSGKDKGRTGDVIQSLPKEGKVVVDGVNVHVRHAKPSQADPQGGLKRAPAPLHVSKVAHVTADGKRYLVAHGDAFDGVIKYAKWLAYLGDTAYHCALTVNHWYNHVRMRLGLQYWSLSAYLKTQVKDAVKFISDFEDAMAAEARRHGYDGVICGHIHKAESRMIDGVHYVNDGDWVESCTALVEHMDGRLEIVEWAANRNFSMLTPTITDDIEESRVPA